MLCNYISKHLISFNLPVWAEETQAGKVSQPSQWLIPFSQPSCTGTKLWVLESCRNLSCKKAEATSDFLTEKSSSTCAQAQAAPGHCHPAPAERTWGDPSSQHLHHHKTRIFFLKHINIRQCFHSQARNRAISLFPCLFPPF